MRVDFGHPDWKNTLTQAYSFRFTETPDFVQAQDHISTSVNAAHCEGFDNISLLSKETYTAGAKASLKCAFEGIGCPEITLVEKPEQCEDGAVRYGACFEIVLWKCGVNVWRHYYDAEHKHCWWHKRLGFSVPFAENTQHTLGVEIIHNYILFTIDGITLKLRTEDLFEQFYVGVTACEGIVRLYELEIVQGCAVSSEDQVS